MTVDEVWLIWGRGGRARVTAPGALAGELVVITHSTICAVKWPGVTC